MEEEILIKAKRFLLAPFDFFVYFLCVLAAATANILLKIGSKNVRIHDALQDPINFLLNNYLLILGYILYLVPAFLTIYLYRKYKVSHIQSLMSAIYIFTPIFAFILGLEGFNLYKVVGIGFIVTGIIFISTQKDDTN